MSPFVSKYTTSKKGNLKNPDDYPSPSSVKSSKEKSKSNLKDQANYSSPTTETTLKSNTEIPTRNL